MDIEELLGQVAEVPAEHRRVIARWLLVRGERYQPSFLMTPEQVQMVQDALTGAAVDLMDPKSEDSTVERAGQILFDLLRG